MDPAQCATAIDEVRALATFIIVVLTVAAIVAMGHLMMPEKPKKQPVQTGEECKLHSRRLEDCRRLGYHDDDRPGWETCGRRGCLIVPKHDHKKDQ